MIYNISARFEGEGKVSMTANGDFKAIQEMISLITATALLEELVVEKVKEKDA